MSGLTDDTADDTLPLGSFHEVSLSTRDLAVSLGFWRAQGWGQVPVKPVWPHPYAAMSRGGIVIGLHEYRFPSPAVTCVHPDIAAALAEHREAGMVIAFAKTGQDCFNEFGFRDPHGHMLTLLEAPTHDRSPADAPPAGATAPDVFLSLPAENQDLGMRFWRVLGATESGVAPEGWPCRRFVAAGLRAALHAPGSLDRPAIVCGGPPGAAADEVARQETPEGVFLVTVVG